MRPRVRVATTGVPPRSRRKAAHGTSAIAVLLLWRNDEAMNLGFLDEDLSVVGENPPLKVENVGRLEKGRWW